MKAFNVIIIALVLVFSSCNVKKSSVLQSHLLQADSSFVSSVDSLGLSSSVEENKNITENKTESQFTKTTEFNDSGRVIRITEVVYLSEFSSVDLSQLFARSDALAGSSTVITTGRTMEQVVDTSESAVSDSRPVQGADWFWVLLWVAVGFVLLFAYKKW